MEEGAPRRSWPVVAAEADRWRLRAAMDAVIAHAYGLDRAQYERVLASFSHRSFRAAPALCLAAFDEFAQRGPRCNSAATTIRIVTFPWSRQLGRAGVIPDDGLRRERQRSLLHAAWSWLQPAHEAYHGAKRLGGNDGHGSGKLRLHRHRRRFGRLRRRGAAQRIRAISRAAAGGRRQGPQSLDPHPDGLLPGLRQSARQLDVRKRTGSATRRPHGCISRAARCSAAPVRSTAWCICAATPPTTTNGGSAAAPAGTGTACCRTSRRPNTRSAAPTSSMASAARCMSPTSRTARNWRIGVVEAAIQAGLPPIEDFNDGRQEGAGYFQSTTGKRRRWSTATAYLRPARGRSQPRGASERARHAHPDRERPCRRRHLCQRRA